MKDIANKEKIEKYIDVGTHKIRALLSDIDSENTIILESGGGMSSDVYSEIQDQLAHQNQMRVLSYDRSGFGKSELGPEHFNALDEVNTLYKCLSILNISRNLILVGHSWGGYLIQLFTQHYPDLVSGLVLIDPMNILFVDRFGLDNMNKLSPYFENPVTNEEKAGNRMVDHSVESFSFMRGKELPENIPVLLITSGNPPIPSIWRKCHQDLVSKSKKYLMYIAEGNNHDIVRENPELVIKKVKELIDLIQFS